MKPLDNLVKELDEILGSPSKKIVSTPVWQEKPETLIENTMNIYSAPIKDYTTYQMAKKRLTVLKEYLPTLTEPLKTKCEAVIKILEKRIAEFEEISLPVLITKVADFVKKPIENQADYEKAKKYLDELAIKKEEVSGGWQTTIQKYINDLTKLMSEYEGQVKLGAPPIPDWIKPFSAEPLFYYREYKETPFHSVESKYAKVTQIKDNEYMVGFEDRDEEMHEKGYPYAPDWDYDEPLLRVRRDGNTLYVTAEKYGGAGISRIKYADLVLWDPIGGWFKAGVGQTKVINLEEAAPQVVTPTPTPTPTPAEKPEVSVKGWLSKYAPWIIAIGALFGGTIAIVREKK